MFSSLKFLLRLLHDPAFGMLAKVWTSDGLWKGFLRCARMMAKESGATSFIAMVQLPDKTLKEALAHPLMKVVCLRATSWLINSFGPRFVTRGSLSLSPSVARARWNVSLRDEKRGIVHCCSMSAGRTHALFLFARAVSYTSSSPRKLALATHVRLNSLRLSFAPSLFVLLSLVCVCVCARVVVGIFAGGERTAATVCADVSEG